MATHRESIHGQWSSRWAFVLAATGSAVGLGNIWKFPYITGANGGGAFVLVYLICILLIGIPIMIAEILIGRHGRQSPINSMRTIAIEQGRNSAWQFLGWGGVIAGFLILSYYSVIAGWALAYVFRTAIGVFSGATADGVNSIFASMIHSPESLIAWHSLFMVMTMVVVSRGVRAGLEKAVRYLIPALFILLLLLVGYAMNSGAFPEGVNFLFEPDFSKITPAGVLIAMGHSFFTLSLGMGAIMVYGSYLPQDASIAKTTFVIAIADTIVALLAGLAIFPIVFANHLEPTTGPGLIFQTLPIAFGHMPGGAFFGTLFFILLVFAAWSSSISLIEPAVAWLVENKGMSRVMASFWCGVGAWMLGLGTVFSFNLWSDARVWDKTFFDILDFVTSNIMLPLGGLFVAIFSAWIMNKHSTQDELAMRFGLAYYIWRFLVRYITPVGVIFVFLNAIGVIKF
jgi:NSS family neurotransmitter:Na+ symporter